MTFIQLLTPKAQTGWVYNDYSIYQVFEKMKEYPYSALPIVDSDGFFRGIITEKDLISLMKKHETINEEDLKSIKIEECKRTKERKAISCFESFDNLVNLLLDQNFVPIVDGRGAYMGLITRKSLISFLYKKDKK